MKFQEGDHVRVIPGTLLEGTDEPIDHWAGEILESFDESSADPAYLVELDAQSLEKVPEAYLEFCLKEDLPYVTYFFSEEEIEAAPRRDTPEAREAAQQKIFGLLVDSLEWPEDEQKQDLDNLLHNFEKSPQYKKMDDDLKEEVRPLVETIQDFAFDYLGDDFNDWDTQTVKEVCCDIMPAKCTADLAFFEKISPILEQFFAFLEQYDLHSKAASMRRKVVEIAPIILKNSQDSSNWGMAKGIMMQATGQGVDFSDEQQLEKFFIQYNANLTGNKTDPKPINLNPLHLNPFKNISRNQMIQVKYANGKIVEGKFKRLESDLRAGKCELISQ